MYWILVFTLSTGVQEMTFTTAASCQAAIQFVEVKYPDSSPSCRPSWEDIEYE